MRFFWDCPRPQPSANSPILFDGDVEVQDILTHPELAIKLDGGVITKIGLNENHIGATCRPYRLQMLYQLRRNTAPPML